MADQNIGAEITVGLDASSADAGLKQLSKTARQQLNEVTQSLDKVQNGLDKLNAAMKKGGDSKVMEKFNRGAALSKTEFDKVRTAIEALIKAQDKLNASAEKAAKKRADSKQAHQERTAITTEAQKIRKENDEIEKRKTATLKAELRQRERAVAAYEAAIRRSMQADVEMQKRITAAIGGTVAAQQRLTMMTQGATPHQALFQQLSNGGIPTNFANYVAGGGRRVPPGFGGAVGGGGFNVTGSGIRGLFGGYGSITNGLGMLGAGLGAVGGIYGIQKGAQQVAELTQLANAYDRMEVAARSLAGSQDKLNGLLEAYQVAAGGAIDQATALESVLRLQATGFAKNAEQITRFVRGSRGASIALGKPQDYITQEVQLAISNTSVKRLDQIGLGIQEVDDRVQQLRDSNKALTREMAFQEAVIGLLNEKYGGLSDTVEGQATGLEKLSTAWQNFRLVSGQALQDDVNDGAAWLSAWIEYFNSYIKAAEEAEKQRRETAREFLKPMGLDFLIRKEPTAPARTPSWMTQATPYAGPPSRNFAEGQVDVMIEWSRAREDIERQTNRALLDEYNNYIDQYRSATQDFQTMMLREEEDYNRNREQQVAQNARQIAEVSEDAARREEKAARDLARNLADLDEDFARQQMIGERDLNRSLESARLDHEDRVREMEEDHSYDIERSRQDSLDRLTEMQTDYDDKITEAREDSTKRLTELETEYTEDREKALKDHNRTIAEAGAALDARAVFFEQRRFEDEQQEAQKAHEKEIADEKQRLLDFEKEADEDHQKQVSKEQERQKKAEEESNANFNRQLEREAQQLAKREEQERASHALRVSDAKEALEQQRQDMIDADALRREDAAQADSDRLDDIKAAITAQQTAEDEDRRIRLERLGQDHDKQLGEMTLQHNKRIKQIQDQGEEERTALDTEFTENLTKLGVYIEGYAQEYDKLKNTAIEKFDEFMIHVVKELEKGATGKPPSANPNQSAIESKKAERAQEIVERDKYPQWSYEWLLHNNRVNVLTEEINELERNGVTGQTSAALASLGGKPISPVAANSSVVNGGAMISIASGAIQITALPGQSPAVLGEEFERRLLGVIKRVSRMA